jgi:hypothetical protein
MVDELARKVVELRARLAEAAGGLESLVDDFLREEVEEPAEELKEALFELAGEVDDEVEDREETTSEGLSRADREGCWKLAQAVRDVLVDLDRVKSLACEPLGDALDDLYRHDGVISELEAAFPEKVTCDEEG